MIKQLRANTSAIVVGAIVVAVVITLLVYGLTPEKLGNWLRTLAATSISALFAVAIGIGLFNRQTKMTDERRRQQLIEVLETEITDIKDEVLTADPGAFTWVVTQSGTAREVLLPEGHEVIAFDEAVRSGLLSPDDTAQLIRLAGGIRAYDARVRRAQSIIQAEIIDKEKIDERGAGYLLDWNVDNLENHRKKVAEECEQMLTRLQQLKN
jgi:hypothetical protein